MSASELREFFRLLSILQSEQSDSSLEIPSDVDCV
ncbi:hypothetical protein T4B_6415 [Trichinella pseudospiralis]|uniref:Uncharacterized protein n=3 Tax=Trichinella TaxID=6333 RepID=A0A0V0WE19_TRIPS|nr:hypothetical protein T4E_4223 [Trichinella pseudospiralis]KRY80389.1 hypothetical protein T4D_9430 [Trichinella pseudospiralis]KRY98581.1 hypothetical protein T4B_6415 [Trichinella pseudospiralis]KRZ64890.1 hypothetical protein T10_9082 [Trichinella papuae]